MDKEELRKKRHRDYMRLYYQRLEKGICSRCGKEKRIFVKSLLLCKYCRRGAQDRLWKKNHLEIINIGREKWRKKTGKNANYYFLRGAFSGNREKVIIRDGEKCVQCGFTRAQSKAEFGFDLAVDHIEGLGRWDSLGGRRNNVENLQTLCCRCHGKKTAMQGKLREV